MFAASTLLVDFWWWEAGPNLASLWSTSVGEEFFLFLGFTLRRGVLLAGLLSAGQLVLYLSATPGLSVPFLLIQGSGGIALAIIVAIIGRRVSSTLFDSQVRDALNRKAVLFAGLYGVSDVTSDVTEWKRQHDEISNTVRRVMLTLLAYGLFCVLTLAAPDAPLLGAGAEIPLPLAGTSVDYVSFLVFGPLILIGVTTYLHIFLQASLELDTPEGARPLPFLFNMRSSTASILSDFLLYWLPVILLGLFAWKALPFPLMDRWLCMLASGGGAIMTYLQCGRQGPNVSFRQQWFSVSTLLLSLCFFFYSMLPGFSLSRSLFLENVDLQGLNLRENNLAGAWMKNANLTNADLSGADLRGVDLSRALLRNANFDSARLDNAVGLDCQELSSALNVDTAVRTSDCDIPAMVTVKPGRRGDAFVIGRKRVSYSEYAEFARSTGRGFPGAINGLQKSTPAKTIGFDDAQAYAKWVSDRSERYDYRLPTWAEWAGAVRMKAFEDLEGNEQNSQKGREQTTEWLSECRDQSCLLGEIVATGKRGKENEPRQRWSDKDSVPEGVRFRLARDAIRQDGDS